MDTNAKTNVKLTYIDFFRLLASFSIVVLHCFREDSGFMNQYGAEIIGRWPVAFFFVVSGFYMKSEIKGMIHYCVRIFIMYLFWTCVYALILGDDIFSLKAMFSALRSGVIMPFWFYSSLIMCVVFVWCIKKLTKSSLITLVICLFLYVIGLMGDSLINISPVNNIMNTYFFPIFERIMGVHTTRNGIFNGSFPIALGVFMNDKSHKTLSLSSIISNKKRLYLCGIITFIAYVSELILNIIMNTGDRNVLIITPILAALIVIIANKRTMTKDTSIFFRKLSSCIFILHYFFLTNIQKFTANQWSWLLVTLLGSITIGIILCLLSKKISALNYII